MPRYFFHSLNGHTDHDVDGVELPNDDAARSQAVIYAGELLRADPMRVWDYGTLRVQVTNVTNDVLFVVLMKAEER